MTRVLRSATKNIQSKQELSSKLSISKNSKNIKRKEKNCIEIKDEAAQVSVWGNNSIMSSIFTYTDHNDLLEFNIVCKKWNSLTNPIIHKTIKLNRSWDIIKRVIDKRLKKVGKKDADVVECISNNAKHAPFVKEFRYSHDLNPQRAIEVFKTFKFISNLSIENCDMSQDQFLGMISPLTQLQELSLSGIGIKSIIRKRIYKEAIQLPATLKKLSLHHIRLINDPELFTRTINSHNNLENFFIHSQSSQVLLEPFYKPYPSLLNFEFINYESQTPQSLFTVFENIPQLTSLKLSLGGWSSELVSYINIYLTNLEELKLSENGRNDIDFFAKFSQPTKIKKLNLEWSRLSNCSLDSILLNCPDLEELLLNRFNTYQRPNSISFISISEPTKIKKLAFDCNDMSRDVIEILLMSCPNLNELDIVLPWEWKEVIKLMYEKCTNLERLAICPSDQTHRYIIDTFYQEFYESEFFISNHTCKSTLKSLVLNRFKVEDSKAEYFKSFEKLKYIKYLDQHIGVDMGLWPGYKLLSKKAEYGYKCDIEFEKIKKLINFLNVNLCFHFKANY